MIDIPLTALYPHPQNPRLMMRDEVVQQIAAQMRVRGTFDPAHALLVRSRADDGSYEILSGVHRVLAAKEAGGETVPCWVREMDDAFMFDPCVAMAEALLLAKEACPLPCFSLWEQTSLTTVNIAFENETFLGEYICPQSHKIDWLTTWMPVRMLAQTLDFWNVPIDPDIFQWELRGNATFFRINGGMFSQQEPQILPLPHDLPDRADDPIFARYSGMECLYFVQAQQRRLIKIGFSSNISKRLASLKTGCPDILQLLTVVPGGSQREKAIHQRCAFQRRHGDWFYPTEELLMFMQNGGRE